jgi:ParB/RepB/Spo0J family partition protein
VEALGWIGGLMANHALANVEGFVKRGREEFRVDPSTLIVEEGFNLREDYGDEDDLALKENIRVNGVLEPIKVQKNTDNQLIMRDGHRRKWCCDELAKEGEPVRSVPVMLTDKRMTPAEAIFLMFNTNETKRFKPLEEAEGCRRLMALGFEVSEIAQRIGKTKQHVYNRLQLVHASAETRQAIKDRKVGVSVAQRAVAQSGGDSSKQKDAIRKATQPKAQITWDKVTKCHVSKGFTPDQELVLSTIMPHGLSKKLLDVGLNPETFKIIVNHLPKEFD